MDTPWYEKAFVSTGFLFDQLNNGLKSVSEWHDDTVAAFDAIGEDPATPEPLRFATALLKLPARIGTGLVSGVGAVASLITNPDSRAELAEGVKTLYENPEIMADAAQAFADKPAYEQASDVIVLASDVVLGGKGAVKAFGKTDGAPTRKVTTRRETDAVIASKKFTPGSLEESLGQLEKRRTDIATNGYIPKYSDDELAYLAKHGDVGAERFQVRFMEEGHLNHKDTPTVPLSGAMGQLMEGASGKGAKYWSTSLDQLEDADTDPKLIAEKLGLKYDPNAKYVLIVVDTEKAAPLTGVKSVPATLEKVGEFANRELPKHFSEAFTRRAMTPEFQAEYARHYQAAQDRKFLKDPWSKNTKHFEDYLKTTGLDQAEIDDMKLRMLMHDKVGNNQDYLGNGLTKDLNTSSPNQFGAVETLNFERKEANLKQLSDAGAITIVQGLKPL